MARPTVWVALLALCAAPCAGIDYPVSLKDSWQATGTFTHPVKAGTCISLKIKIPQDATLALATSKFEGFTPHIIVSLNQKADDTCFVHTGDPCVGCRVLTEDEHLDHTCYVVATTFYVEIFNPGTTDGTYTYGGADLGMPAAGVTCQDKDMPDEPCGKADVPACNVVDGKAEGGAIAGYKALGTCHCECFSGWEGDDCSVQTGASPAPPTDAPTDTPTDAPTDAPTDVPMTDAPTAVPTDAPTDVPDTDAPPTDAPPTDAPPTDAPPTDAPPTNAPPTDAPPTDAPPTDVPPTDAPATDAPPTDTPPTTAVPQDPAATAVPPAGNTTAGTPSPGGPPANATAGPGAVAPLPANGTTGAPGGGGAPPATETPLAPNATAAPAGTGTLPASTDIPLGAAAGGDDGSSGSEDGQGLLVVAVVLAAAAFLVAVAVAVWVCCVRGPAGAGGKRRGDDEGDEDVYLEMMSPEEAVFGTRLHSTPPGSLQAPLSPLSAGGGGGGGGGGGDGTQQRSGVFKPPTYDPEYDSDSSILSAGRRSLGSESEMALLPGTDRLLPY